MRLGNWFINLKLILNVRKSERTKGISSICSDQQQQHVLMLDYDQIDKTLAVKELRYIQQKFQLTPFYLFTTKEQKVNGEVIGNYHAISLTKFTPAKIIEIQKETHCDSNYITMPIRNKYRSWVLRCTYKGKREPPQYLGIIGKMENLDKEVSQAHLNFFKIVYNIDDIPYTNLDGLESVDGHKYTTLNV